MSTSTKIDVETAHRVETPRLILRLHYLSDAPALNAVMKNPANLIYDPVHEPNTEDSAAAFESEIRKWRSEAAIGKKALWVVCLRNPDGSGGELIGCGGYPWLPANADGRPGNTGVLIDESWSRQGYGSEALIATLDYGFDVLGFEAIEQCTLEENKPYRSMLQSIGLEPYGKSALPDIKGRPEWAYTVTKEQWQKVKAEKSAKA